MQKEDFTFITVALRTGQLKIILQHQYDPKQNKRLIYNGCSTNSNGEREIYLVEE